MPELAAIILLGLHGCGGGGGGGSGGSAGASTFTPGVFLPASSFAAKCASPRSGTDPVTGSAYPDVRGSRTDENNWLRSWSNDLYLWYGELPDLDPASYATAAYFNLLKTSAATSSGNPKDKFHFTYTTAQWQSLSRSGVDVGYGATWAIVAATPPRRVVVAYVEDNSPAAPSLARGIEIQAVDGADVVSASDQASVDKINAGLFPQNVGETHTFLLRLTNGTSAAVTLQAANVTSTPVRVAHVETNGNVGYLLFNDHLASAETQLVAAFTMFQQAHVNELVLDLRYNGGGFLDIASEVAYMIAGPVPTAGRPFEKMIFNDKHPSTNPVTGQALAPIPFYSTTQGFSLPPGQALPTLNLSRVFVLTGASTCSASESIINGLRGADVEVIQIGSTTCGKPYGFYPQDNCGTTYFSIQFEGANAKNFVGYSDGFSPANASGGSGVAIPGCSVADDFGHVLGDPMEARFAAALNYSVDQSCPTPPSGNAGAGQSLKTASPVADVLVLKSPWLENRILREPGG